MKIKRVDFFRSNSKNYIVILALITIFVINSNLNIVKATNSQSNNTLIHMKISGTIDEATVMDVSDALSLAIELNVRLVIVELSTPGGTVDATEKIMKKFSNSEIPILGWVSRGSTALSGGTYILESCHMAVMGETSQIGSCQPVDDTGRPITDSKYVNALIELLTGKTEYFGRNSTQTERFITENLNLDENEALATNAIDLIGSSMNDVLSNLENYQLIRYTDGMTNKWKVLPISSNITELGTIERLETFEDVTSAEIVEYSSSLATSLLNLLSDPLLLSILFIIGTYGLVFGLLTPGAGAEIVGIISLLLFLIGSFSVNLGLGVLLLFALSIILFLIESHQGHGFFALIGTAILFIAGLFILPSSSWLATTKSLEAARLIILIGSIFLGVFFILIGVFASQSRNAPARIGPESYIGQPVIIFENVIPNSIKGGKIKFVSKEPGIWNARTNYKKFVINEVAVVEEVDGFTLWIKPIKNEEYEN